MEFFLCNKHKIVLKPIMHQNSAVSEALLGITDYKYRFWIEQVIAFMQVIGYLVKPLINQ